MIVVIQCAASKRSGAGHLLTPDGRRVHFVADPNAAPVDAAVVYARPDDFLENRTRWRDVLLKYNKGSPDNPLGLYPAYKLYGNRTYARLVDRLGIQNVFILSAGWGLIRADFLTPYYDITFSQSADAYKRRRKTDRYDDFCMLSASDQGEVLFFGGKDYVPLFCSLTSAVPGRKTVFYNSAQIPQAPGCLLKRFNTTTRTNWHYECANAFLDGVIAP